MDANLIIALVVGILAGAALGWFLGARPAADWKRRFEERDGEFKRAVIDLEGMSEKLGKANTELATMTERATRADQLEVNLETARAKVATFEAERAGFAEQKKLLGESRDKLLKEFENTGAKVLGAAQEKFLASANERFGHAEKSSEEKIKALLSPVGIEFAKLSKKVEEFDEKRVADFGNLKGLIKLMTEGQEAVRAEAAQLGSSLRNAPKTRGRWGEHQLRNVLEQCGLTEHTDFELEASVQGSEGRMRPDAIVRIPGDKELIIDSKLSLNAYQDAFAADSEEDRRAHLKKHADAMKSHIQTLSSKNYQNQFEKAPDYVVMFVAGEHFLSAALESDGDLWDFAFKRRVLLATPTNLIAIARTVASVWQQKQLADDAHEIAKIARLLFESVSKVSADFQKMGRNLGLAVKSYNEFGKTLEGNLTSRARRLSERYIDVGSKEISDFEFIEEEPRFQEEVKQVEDGREAAE